MQMDLIDTRLLMLALIAAVGYALATIGMKIASAQWGILAGLMIMVGFYAAMQSEIMLMRGMELGVLYLMIVAAETLLVLGYAFFIGEGLSLRESAGAVMIFAGIAVVLE